VDDIHPWIVRDVEKFKKCVIDKMLQDLLVNCTNYREYYPIAQEHEGIECLVGDSFRQVPWFGNKK
jgi:hypothetical protein